MAESLLGYRELLKGIKDVCILRESLRLPALQVLLASAQTSVVFCEAAAMTGLPQVVCIPNTLPLCFLIAFWQICRF